MQYSFNRNKEGVVFANTKDVNASHKDLGAVCTAIRYKSVNMALQTLDGVIEEGRPILFRKHNTHMGSRHELGGRKGRYPIKCAMIVRKVLVNAAANARNKGMTPDLMFVVHSSANKTTIYRRGPPKGTLIAMKGLYGFSPTRHADLEHARVELAIATPDAKGLSDNMKHQIQRFSAIEKKYYSKVMDKKKVEKLKKEGIKLLQKKEEKKPEQKKDAKANPAPKPQDPVNKTEQKAEQKAEEKRNVEVQKEKKESSANAPQHKGAP